MAFIVSLLSGQKIKRKIVRENLYNFFLLTVIIFSFSGCPKEHRETPTKGITTIYADESLSPLIFREAERFHQLYDEAIIHVKSSESRDCIVAMLNDTSKKIKCIVTSRAMNSEELSFAKQNNIDIQEYIFAKDGIAIIINSKNKVKQLRTSQLDSIFSGNLADWQLVDRNAANSKIRIALPNANSGNLEYLSKNLLLGKKFTHASFTGTTSREIIRFISNDIAAIGFVSICWRDSMDSTITMVELQNTSPPDSVKQISTEFFGPVQAYIALGYFPLSKLVYCYTRDDDYTVSGGFTTFLLDPSPSGGQKIVADFGMVPVRMPIRYIQLNKNNLQ